MTADPMDRRTAPDASAIYTHPHQRMFQREQSRTMREASWEHEGWSWMREGIAAAALVVFIVSAFVFVGALANGS